MTKITKSIKKTVVGVTRKSIKRKLGPIKRKSKLSKPIKRKSKFGRKSNRKFNRKINIKTRKSYKKGKKSVKRGRKSIKKFKFGLGPTTRSNTTPNPLGLSMTPAKPSTGVPTDRQITGYNQKPTTKKEGNSKITSSPGYKKFAAKMQQSSNIWANAVIRNPSVVGVSSLEFYEGGAEYADETKTPYKGFLKEIE